jgi:hypothetical protein
MTMEMNRCAILAGAAALPATTFPVIAAPAAPDPIFAKIAGSADAEGDESGNGARDHQQSN